MSCVLVSLDTGANAVVCACIVRPGSNACMHPANDQFSCVLVSLDTEAKAVMRVCVVTLEPTQVIIEYSYCTHYICPYLCQWLALCCVMCLFLQTDSDHQFG